MEPLIKKPIYEYDDYRDFLYHSYLFKKEASPVFTYEFCARKLNVAKSYLQLIFKKKRQASLEKIWEIAALIDIDSRELKYLVFLFLYNTTEEEKIKSYFQEILRNLEDILIYYHRNKTTLDEGNSESKIISSSWLHMAIYNLVKLDHFENDLKWICDELGLKNAMEEKVKAVIDDLVNHKMLIKDEDHLIVNQSYSSNPSTYDSGEYRDYKGIMKRALDVIEDVDLYRPYTFQGRGLPISIENSVKLLDLYQDLYKKILEIEKEDQKREIVVFISNNVYTVTVVKE